MINRCAPAVEQFSVVVRERKQHLQSGPWVSKGWEPLAYLFCSNLNFVVTYLVKDVGCTQSLTCMRSSVMMSFGINASCGQIQKRHAKETETDMQGVGGESNGPESGMQQGRLQPCRSKFLAI